MSRINRPIYPTVNPPLIPRHHSGPPSPSSQPAAELPDDHEHVERKAAFVPFRPSWSRVAIYRAMRPLMWAAKLIMALIFHLRGAKRRIVSVDGLQICLWTIEGKQAKGPVGVLLHGLGGSASEYLPAINLMRESCCRVVAVDLPGHGFSSSIGGQPRTGFRDVNRVASRLVEAVQQAVETTLEGRPACFIGHSLGGFVAAKIVGNRARQKQRDRLLLVESDGAPWSESRLVADRTDFSVASAASVRRVARATYPMRPLVAAFYSPFVWARLASPSIQFLVHSDLKQPTLSPDDLARLPSDTGIIIGQYDRFGTEEDQHYFLTHLPSGRRLWRPPTGHGDFVDGHPALDEIVTKFLSE